MIAGVYSDGTREAVELARDAKAAGRRRPPASSRRPCSCGAPSSSPTWSIRHFSESLPARTFPIVVFEYPPASGIGYAPETLARLCEIPHVAGVKDWSNDIVAFERNLRALRATGRRWRCSPRSRCR